MGFSPEPRAERRERERADRSRCEGEGGERVAAVAEGDREDSPQCGVRGKRDAGTAKVQPSAVRLRDTVELDAPKCVAPICVKEAQDRVSKEYTSSLICSF